MDFYTIYQVSVKSGILLCWSSKLKDKTDSIYHNTTTINYEHISEIYLFICLYVSPSREFIYLFLFFIYFYFLFIFIYLFLLTLVVDNKEENIYSGVETTTLSNSPLSPVKG